MSFTAKINTGIIANDGKGAGLRTNMRILIANDVYLRELLAKNTSKLLNFNSQLTGLNTSFGNHNHDDRYYRNYEVDKFLNTKLGVNETAKNALNAYKLGDKPPSYYVAKQDVYDKQESDNALLLAMNEVVQMLLNNPDAEINSIQELLAEMNTADNALITSIANKVSYVVFQNLSEEQQKIAQKNIGLLNHKHDNYVRKDVPESLKEKITWDVTDEQAIQIIKRGISSGLNIDILGLGIGLTTENKTGGIALSQWNSGSGINHRVISKINSTGDIYVLLKEFTPNVYTPVLRIDNLGNVKFQEATLEVIKEDLKASKILVADKTGKVTYQNKDIFWTGDNKTLSKNIEDTRLIDEITVTSSCRPAKNDPSNPFGKHSMIFHIQHPYESGFAQQIAYTMDIADGEVYYRNKKKGTWSSWRKVLMTDDLPKQTVKPLSSVTTYTAKASDVGNIVPLSNANTQIILNTSSFPRIGDKSQYFYKGTGTCKVATSGSASELCNINDTLEFDGQYSMIEITKTGANEYFVCGQLIRA
ncbi:conserved hypothetical protein. Putative prophage protein [Tenacibaculum dicentrarchi]|nr:conserved hypothetical protein. Putative prophage protein [Tenacibaculum dicentrarchi]